VERNYRLISLRKAKGLTQEQVAKLVGLKRASYAQIERGRVPSFKYALRLAHIFGVPVEEIFSPDAVLKQHNTRAAGE
jgi:putative transcriptional regulator